MSLIDVTQHLTLLLNISQNFHSMLLVYVEVYCRLSVRVLVYIRRLCACSPHKIYVLVIILPCNGNFFHELLLFAILGILSIKWEMDDDLM